MRGRSAILVALLALCALPPALADGKSLDVLVVRFSGEPGEMRYRYQDLPAAVRFLSPVAFSVGSGRVVLRADSGSGVLERERSVVARRPVGDLQKVSMLVSSSDSKPPRPARSVSVSFTLDELLAEGGAWSAVPAAWACYLAAAKSGWASGRVWARALAFDKRTSKFTVKVGLLK